MPTFTVVCPTYNRGRAILSTLDSVRAQSLDDWELIVVSDASDDNTDEVVAEAARDEPRMRLQRTRRHGSQSGPTNAALESARGDFVAYIDHDDLWEPDHLQTLAEVLGTGAAFVATRTRKMDPAGAVTATNHPARMLWHPEIQLMNPVFENSCAAHAAGLAEAVGGWRESPIGLEDWDLWLRFADAGIACATLLDCTVRILEAPHTRQHSLPVPHRHEIGRFPDPLAARAAYRAVTDTRALEQERQACLADVRAWYRSLADRGELVFPKGWQGGEDALDAALREHVERSWSEGMSLVIDRQDGYYSLAAPIATMTAEHAQRYTDFFSRMMTRQVEHYHRVLPTGSCVL